MDEPYWSWGVMEMAVARAEEAKARVFGILSGNLART
jgi:hypothetical protein